MRLYYNTVSKLLLECLHENDILNSLCHSAELKQDNVIECLKGKYWELIVEDLQTIAEQSR